ncbi:MAG: chemotaxis protein CheW [Microcoleaceae cyanobacterium]
MVNPYSISRTENYLSFYLTPQYQALLSTIALAEIIHLDASEIVPIPEMPSAVAGVCSWQGEVLWVVDLSYWSGAAPLLSSTSTLSQSQKNADHAAYTGTQAHCNILKVRCQGGTLGLLVHQVGQLKSCEVQHIQPLKNNTASSQLTLGNEAELTAQLLPTTAHGRPTVRQECIKGIWNSPSGERLAILDLDTVVQHLVQ